MGALATVGVEYHYAFRLVRVAEGTWYAGSTDSFTFADDPDQPNGIVVLDTDRGQCTHVPLSDRRQLVTLESIYGLGLSPRELQEKVLERAASIPAGAVARLYVESVDPDVWHLLDLHAVRDAARAGLHLKLEPVFVATTMRTELPTATSLQSQWDGYVSGQDLTGLDRGRVQALGHDYLERAIVGPDVGTQC